MSPPGPTKGEAMASTALQLNNTCRQRRVAILPLSSPASSDLLRRCFPVSIGFGATTGESLISTGKWKNQRTTSEEGKIRCMRSRSCFWWPPTGNQFNPALQSVPICLISCSVSLTSECKRRVENRNLLMICGFAL